MPIKWKSEVPKEGPAFSIRPIGVGDQEDVYRLLGGDSTDIPFDHPGHPANESIALIRNSQSDKPEGGGWLAIAANGRAAGIITTKNFSGGIYVDPAYRGQGIAEGLVLACEAYMKAQGETHAHAHIRADNIPSMKLHQKLGYVPEDSAPGLSDGARVPVLVMTKTL
jgi:RimJ/RimL family protein N-acetyltransferase